MPVAKRCDVSPADCWNLEKLFTSDEEWEQTLSQFTKTMIQLASYQKTMTTSAQALRQALDAYMQCDMTAERLGYYAMLRLQEDLGDAKANEHYAKCLQIQSQYAKLTSFFLPTIQSINEETLNTWCKSEVLAPYQGYLKRIIRYKSHTLPAEQEALLAPLGEIFSTPNQTFSALTDVDMQFGSVRIKDKDIPLTQASFTTLIKDPDPKVRQTVYNQFYATYNQHKNTLAALYAGSIKQDLYSAQIRHFDDTRQAALFPDQVPTCVYDNLISTVRAHLPILHRYYKFRRKVLKLDVLRHCDVYTPLFPTARTHYPYQEGVELVCAALAPLGNDYCQRLRAGLLGHWVDKYENQGKCSGAFSAGSYLGEPYILLNYQPDNIRSVFTLAHEAGHSMHSLYSIENNTYQDYQYSIFEAETASTFNESMLFYYLLNNTDDRQLKISLISERLDDILATLFRQTMFAEFEFRVHQCAAEGRPLTLELFRKTYRELLRDYFGDAVELSDVSDLEGLRIPHFYRPFYVYKYATGIAASLALSEKVLHGDKNAQQQYLAFLKNGGRSFPIDSLKLAGVDMADPAPIETAIQHFEALLQQCENFVQ